MGNMAYLMREDNRTLFNLGKTHDGIYMAFPHAAVFRADRIENLAGIMCEAWNASDWPKAPSSDDEDRAWFKELATRVLVWAGSSMVACIGEDVADDLLEAGYRVTGSRYSDE